jgi:dihydroflavonol-4-reductase
MEKHISVVTGATGRIGFPLCMELKKRGHFVRAFCRKSPVAEKLTPMVDEIVYGDLRDADSLTAVFAGAEYVFHLGGIVAITTKLTPEIEAVNVGGTANVIQACGQCGIKRLVYTGSVHALHFTNTTDVLREIDRFCPDKVGGGYAISKTRACNLVLDAVAEGLDAVIGLPSGVIGAYEYRLSNIGQMVRDVARRRLPMYIKGEYDFVDTLDVAAGLADLAEKGVKGESYILSGHRCSVKEMVECVARHAQVKPPHMCAPFWLAKLFALPLEKFYVMLGKMPLFTPYSLKVLRDNCNFSHEKMTALTGYAPRSLDEAFKSQVEFNAIAH